MQFFLYQANSLFFLNKFRIFDFFAFLTMAFQKKKIKAILVVPDTPEKFLSYKIISQVHNFPFIFQKLQKKFQPEIIFKKYV